MKILIARFLAFGDVLLTLPLAQALRNSPAVDRLDLLTSAGYAAMPEASGMFDRVYRVDAGDEELSELRRRHYDRLLDLHARSVPLQADHENALAAVRAGRVVRFAPQWGGPIAGGLPSRGFDEHAVEYYARSAEELIAGPLPDGRFVLPAPYRIWAADHLGRPAVCVMPGARYEFKRWPAERYVSLITLLRTAGLDVLVLGHPFDAEVTTKVARAADCRSVVDADELRLAALLARAGTAVTNNTGLMHLAQLAGARCVCIHSHTSPRMWRPWGDGHRDLTGAGTPCACGDIGAFELPFPCGKDIPPDQVAAAATELTAGTSLGGEAR